MCAEINMIGVYFESWACPWTDKPEQCALALIEKPIEIVYLSFARPDCTYKKSQGTWEGTGLDFSPGFQVIRQAIQILKPHLRTSHNKNSETKRNQGLAGCRWG